MSLEAYFSVYRNSIVGNDLTLATDDDQHIPVIYADWTASGRLYQPIEEYLLISSSCRFIILSIVRFGGWSK